MVSMGHVSVSVIIPVYNDAEPLRKCMRALDEQTYSTKRYEVIVVDNASDEDINSVVESCSFARTLSEPQQGSYAARNLGIQEAEGEILAFTDADCIPSSTWIKKGVQRLTEETSCKLVGGRVDFYFQNTNCPTPAELFDSTHFLNQKRYVSEGKFAATANAFTWKRIFEEVGLFDETLHSGGDTEWGHRLHERGYNICYEEGARVKHPARYSYRALRTKKLRILEGTTRSRKEEGYPLWELVVHVVKDVGHHLKFALRTAVEEGYSLRETTELLIAFPFQGICTASKRIELWFRE